jgi:hypothetical protein
MSHKYDVEDVVVVNNYGDADPNEHDFSAVGPQRHAQVIEVVELEEGVFYWIRQYAPVHDVFVAESMLHIA